MKRRWPATTELTPRDLARRRLLGARSSATLRGPDVASALGTLLGVCGPRCLVSRLVVDAHVGTDAAAVDAPLGALLQPQRFPMLTQLHAILWHDSGPTGFRCPIARSQWGSLWDLVRDGGLEELTVDASPLFPSGFVPELWSYRMEQSVPDVFNLEALVRAVREAPPRLRALTLHQVHGIRFDRFEELWTACAGARPRRLDTLSVPSVVAFGSMLRALERGGTEALHTALPWVGSLLRLTADDNRETRPRPFDALWGPLLGRMDELCRTDGRVRTVRHEVWLLGRPILNQAAFLPTETDPPPPHPSPPPSFAVRLELDVFARVRNLGPIFRSSRRVAALLARHTAGTVLRFPVSHAPAGGEDLSIDVVARLVSHTLRASSSGGGGEGSATPTCLPLCIALHLNRLQWGEAYLLDHPQDAASNLPMFVHEIRQDLAVSVEMAASVVAALLLRSGLLCFPRERWCIVLEEGCCNARWTEPLGNVPSSLPRGGATDARARWASALHAALRDHRMPPSFVADEPDERPWRERVARTRDTVQTEDAESYATLVARDHLLVMPHRATTSAEELVQEWVAEVI